MQFPTRETLTVAWGPCKAHRQRQQQRAGPLRLAAQVTALSCTSLLLLMLRGAFACLAGICGPAYRVTACPRRARARIIALCLLVNALVFW
jgi:hypothetical protein